MATFESRITSLTGRAPSTSAEQDELALWLTDGAAEILDSLPQNLVEKYATTVTTLDNSTTTVTGIGAKGRLGGVFRLDADSSGVDRPCRFVPTSKRGQVQDSSDMNFATATDPVYLYYDEVLEVYPVPTANQTARVLFNDYLTISTSDITSSDITDLNSLPKGSIRLLLLYGAIKSIQHYMIELARDTDVTTALTAVNTELDETQAICDLINTQVTAAVTQLGESATQVDADVDTALASIKTEIDKVDEIILLAHEEFDEVAAEVSSTATSPITQARAAVPSAISISDLSISASAPSAPSLATLSYSNASNADASSSAVSPITVSTVSVADTSGNVPTYTKPSTTVNFGSGNNFDTLLGTNEDIELASVELQKQNQLLSAYSTDIQNELNEYNKENVRYQASVQAELAKHNTDLQVALRQAQVNAADAQQEASQATDVDKFNKAQDQALDLQNKAQALQAAIQNNDDLVSKFNAEISKYNAEVNDAVQEYQANIQQKVQELESSIKIQSSYYQEAQARINAGNAFLQQAQTTISQAGAYANEVNARMAQIGGYSQVITGYISAAQGYANEIQSKINIAQAYGNEAQVRLAQNTSKYEQYSRLVDKYQAEYKEGLGKLR